MTAYGAVNSLRNTIDYILHSSHFILVDPSPHILQLAYEELNPLQDTLEKLDRTRPSKSRKKVNALDGIIKELIWKFEDLLESLLYQQILFQSHPPHHTTTTSRRRRRRLLVHKQKLRKLTNEFEARSLEVEGKMKDGAWGLQGLLESLYSQPQILFQSHPPHHTTTTSRRRRRRRLQLVHKRKRRKFISLEDEDDDGGERFRFSIDLRFLQHHVPSFIQRLKYMEQEYIYEVCIMPDEDNDDESISSRSGTKSKLIGLSDQFQQLKRELMECDWGYNYIVLTGTAGIGKTALAEAVFEDSEILSLFEHSVWVTVGRKFQFNDVSRAILAQMFGITQGDHELGAYLKGKKCLIVLDDVWETQIFYSLRNSLRNNSSGSTYILVTARDRIIGDSMLVRFLNEEESKELLCEKVFGEEGCPFQLDKAATKIAKICEGLPLTIVTVADILSKAQNTDPKYWNNVAEMRNSVFTDAYNEISKVLFPSYDYLAQQLKMPFLYMGVFPSNYDIPVSGKFKNMLATEGWFHITNQLHFLVDPLENCLEELCKIKNLVLFNERYITEWVDCSIKTCRLHSSWRYMCRGEARKNKFYYVLKKLVEGLEDGIKGQRCLCLENNLLFGIKEFCNSVRLNCASTTRSLLFFGPYHQYPIPIGDNFKLLGKLDALNLRLYTFPTEILTLVLLKYLALTCNGELPTTISKLFNLRILIIHPHNNITICGAPSYVPIEIWDMKELKHIEILGKSLVAPCHSASLEKLSTLVGVNASISTILELSQKVPRIRKLGVRIELTPYDDHNDLLSCFGCISTLERLAILKCSITNPVVIYNYVFPNSLMVFPILLRKLHLSGMGFSWEYMDEIGYLPLLQVLKLRAYAFQGPKWEAQEKSFLSLEFLLIEDSDLVQWKPRSGSFPELKCLSMKHCYKLQEIHWFGTIELENCNPAVLTWAKQFQPTPYGFLDVTATSSFDEKPTTIKFQRHGFEKWRRKDGDVKTES